MRPTFQPFEDIGSYGADKEEDRERAWEATIDELLRIRKLEDDWDGEGTLAPNSALVDGAINLAMKLRAQRMSAPDRVHASVNETLYFEWHDADGYLEIEVVSPVDAECRVLPKGSNTAEVYYLSCQS